MAKTSKKIQLGDEVKCTVSGFKGVATSRCEYLNGCIQYGVKPKVGKDNKQVAASYVDAEQLRVTKAKNPPRPEPKARRGGPSTDAPRLHRGRME